MIATRFQKDGQDVWTNGEITSACAVVTDESLDLNTGFTREEKMLFWVKSNNAEGIDKAVNGVITSINKGVLKAHRAFSNEPFYAGQAQDINPSTNESLGRYSQVRLCPSDKFETLHRQYVTVEAKVASDYTA